MDKIVSFHLVMSKPCLDGVEPATIQPIYRRKKKPRAIRRKGKKRIKFVKKNRGAYFTMKLNKCFFYYYYSIFAKCTLKTSHSARKIKKIYLKEST